MRFQDGSELTDPQSPGLSAFDTLHAEAEPWLPACFVPPPEFDLMAGARSVIVMGEPGAGKSAVYHMLLHRYRPPDRRPAWLVVEWQPPALPGASDDSGTAEQVLSHALAACAMELMRHVTRWPADIANAPEDTQNTLAWFIQRYQTAGGNADPGGLLPRTFESELLDQMEVQHQLGELIKALGEIGLSGVRILIEPAKPNRWELIQAGLSALLSSLNLFEQPQFVYKFVLSVEQGVDLLNTAGVEKRRIHPTPLRWLEPELQSIVDRRLYVATGGKASSLNEVCADKKLVDWLRRYGGDVPRGRLELLRPLVSHYLTRGRRLTNTEWQDILKSRPPTLTVDLKTGRVTIGRKEVAGIGPVEMALLCYLYQNRGRICKRDELFHKAYLPFAYPDQTDQHVDQIHFAGVLDTALWRLRSVLEPDPHKPIYVITKRGKGVLLDNAW